MSFTGLAYNQAVSYNNLQDAVNNGIFTLVSSIPATNQESTKSFVASHVSGFNPNYPPYAVKASNQLIVQQDIYQPGNFILDAQYGMSFTSMSGSVGLPTFSPAFTYPVTGSNTTSQYNGAIAAQTITIGLTGTRVITPLKVVLYVDGVQVDCKDITANGVQTKTLNLSVTVASPSTVKISINGGTCASTPVNPIFTSKPFNAVAVNRGSGQYMIAGNTSIYSYEVAGYLYYSSNYGSTWTQSSLYGYFGFISMSDNGQYVIVNTKGNNYNYLSSDYGATYTAITSLPYYGGISSAISNDGQYQLIVAYTGTLNDIRLYSSSNYGSTWTNLTGNIGNVIPTDCAMDASAGVYLLSGYARTGAGAGYILKSTNYGSSWTTVYYDASLFNKVPDKIAINASNGWAMCIVYNTSGYPQNIFKSNNSGSSWSQIGGSGSGQNFYNISINTSNGNTGYMTIFDSINNKYIQVSTSGLSSINDLTSSGSRKWGSIANSDNGTYILAGSDSGLYLSTDGGSSFSAL